MYKTIEVYPKPGIICHTEAVWQWDHGDVAGYPKSFDSVNYDNNTDRTFEVAEAGYRTAESAMLMDTNPVRVMHVITLDRSDGQRIYKRRKGDFPVWPEPEESTEEQSTI